MRCGKMLRRNKWTHTAVLSFNDPGINLQRARRTFRGWDAQISRQLLSSRWQKKCDERLVWCAFLEGHGHYPHWHLLVEALPAQFELFEQGAGPIWTRLAPSGSTSVRAIYDREGAILYGTKMLRDHVSYASFCHSLEFIRS